MKEDNKTVKNMAFVELLNLFMKRLKFMEWNGVESEKREMGILVKLNGLHELLLYCYLTTFFVLPFS